MTTFWLIAPNQIDDASLSGSDWQSGNPVTNLQNRTLSKVVRSQSLAGGAEPVLDIDFGEPVELDALVLANDNLTTDATYTLTASDNSDMSSPVYESGTLDRWSSIASSLSLSWRAKNWWSGKPTQDDIKRFPRNLIHLLSSTVYARYWRFTFTDPTNTDDFVQFGRALAGRAWVPDVRPSRGLTLGYETDTLVDKALGGAEYFDRRDGYRVLRFQLPMMDRDTGLGRALDLQRDLGIDGEVFVVVNSEMPNHIMRQSFIGRFRQLSPLEYYALNMSRASFEIKELQ